MLPDYKRSKGVASEVNDFNNQLIKYPTKDY